MEVNNKEIFDEALLDKYIKDAMDNFFEQAVIEQPENPMSALGSINKNDINEMANNWHRVPTPDELMKDNNRLRRIITRYIDRLNYLLDHTSQQNTYYSALEALEKIINEEI